MKDKRKKPTDFNLLNLIIQELNEDPKRKLNIAFCLMTVIPFLVFFYVLVERVANIEVLVGNTGLILTIAVFIALGGFFIGYSIIKKILDKTMFYAAQLKRSDKIKSSYVMAVSHELKNPISVVKTNISNILEGLVGKADEQQKKVLQVCQNVIDRVNYLVRQLVDVHKMESNVVEIKRELCDLVEILEGQVNELKNTFEEKNIKLIKKIIHKDLAMWADYEKMNQVINNLLDNALRHTPEGGDVVLKVQPVDKFVRLECINTGAPIEQKRLDKIFDKFRSIEDQEEADLGLVITKDIVELHKGKIWAENIPGGGSKFIVILPRDLRQDKRS